MTEDNEELSQLAGIERGIDDHDEFQTLLNHKIQIFESLANDSLKILSIQLFIVPISLSIISLIEQGNLPFVGTSSALSKENIAPPELSGLIIAFSFAIVAIISVISSYHYCRWRANTLPALLLYRKGLAKKPAPKLTRLVTYLSSEETAKELESVPEEQTAQEQLLYGYPGMGSIEAFVRGVLSLSLLVSFGSLAYLLTDILDADFPVWLLISLLAIIILSLTPYMYAAGHIYAVLEGSAGFIFRFINLLRELLYRLFRRQATTVFAWTLDNPMKSLFGSTGLYLFGMALFMSDIWTESALLVAFSLFIGIYGIIPLSINLIK
ncbi:hypothetical protein [Haloarcula amylolytica]|uniref:Uncharacterized protein n=1 Tax=Haloarcula amylolytica JCM 13557 TaxID=1227452 RepID=M0KSE4_9EURY|nr:hypothetical protein [Haloarcula amylolytica]EMA23119.1 hypothetical protein C442_08836 [Haloarcula amylolytica JCM 13557]